MMRLLTDCILIICGLIQAQGFKFNVNGRIDFGDDASESSVLDKISRYLQKAQHPAADGPSPYRMPPATASSEDLPAFNSGEMQRWLENGQKYGIPRLREPSKPPQTVLQEINSKDLKHLHLFGSNPHRGDFGLKHAPKNFISV